MVLSQKETTYLQDLKKEEQDCIEKYTRYASLAKDQKLKDLFNEIGAAEKTHLDTINCILNGNIPDMSTSSKGSQTASSPAPSPQVNTALNEDKKNDQYLCNDTLATEKYVSSVYNTGIFEFKDARIRDILNHIQKEEQEHGKKIYDYMAANGLYA
ncbi:MAG: spore coat protein [Ruminococcaceae bacterium]|nr:spore coat protein [Oscillospiraceae bacterium]